MSEWVFFHDRLVPAAEAHVDIHDAGLLHGVGLFETLRSYGGLMFRLSDHLDRLYRSAEQLGIPIGQDRQQLADGLGELLEANHLPDARIRLTATRGSYRQSQTDEPAGGTLFATAAAAEMYPPEYYQRGMTVLVSDARVNPHDPTVAHKTLNYFARLLVLRQAQAKQAGESLWFTTDHRLAEGCLSNVFLVKADTLLTPPLDTPILPGITRRVVLELAEREGIACEQRALTVQDLLGADEVFLTNSIMELMPVCRIERHAVGKDQPGPIYRVLQQRYRSAVARECKLT
ncbi:MAG: aminotransferase class IV family protein [Sedimentisphaerales bacterium]|nr:aminotransferase class IV family protein [Sedimentisphaerales bacterium]